MLRSPTPGWGDVVKVAAATVGCIFAWSSCGDDAVEVGAPLRGGVSCGSAGSCNVSAGEICCVVVEGAPANYCATSCGSDTLVQLACDTADDCGGATCCGNFDEGWSCSKLRWAPG